MRAAVARVAVLVCAALLVAGFASYAVTGVMFSWFAMAEAGFGLAGGLTSLGLRRARRNAEREGK